jgi:hypothetical protein
MRRSCHCERSEAIQKKKIEFTEGTKATKSTMKVAAP